MAFLEFIAPWVVAVGGVYLGFVLICVLLDA